MTGHDTRKVPGLMYSYDSNRFQNSNQTTEFEQFGTVDTLRREEFLRSLMPARRMRCALVSGQRKPRETTGITPRIGSAALTLARDTGRKLPFVKSCPQSKAAVGQKMSPPSPSHRPSNTRGRLQTWLTLSSRRPHVDAFRRLSPDHRCPCLLLTVSQLF